VSEPIAALDRKSLAHRVAAIGRMRTDAADDQAS
jgi:hypothetical protein